MIVKGFKGRRIYGYLDFNMKFNKDISFLIGSNGSGKTTALKLMNALVTPNFKELIKTPFESITITLENKGQEISITCVQHEKFKELTISSLVDSIQLPYFSQNEINFLSHRSDKIEEAIDELNRKYLSHPVISAINKIDSPIFLGLDRRGEEIKNIDNDYYFERQMWYSNKKNSPINTKRLISGSLGASLMETELLVQNSYRRIRELEQKQSSRLRDSILLSVFQYNDFDSTGLHDNLKSINNWKEKEGLIKRQGEIKDALSNIGLKDSRLTDEVDKFFSKITSLFGQLSNMDKGLSLEWLLNKAQVERMSKIVEIIDEHNSKVDSYFKPINYFITTINSFYKDSHKTLQIDAIGQLVVLRPDGVKCTIEALSSGEQQLLVIFAHAYFNRNSKSSVFIIDEPELSLHLGWQEKFTETIAKISENSQFILATHSPEIVGNNKQKTVKCR